MWVSISHKLLHILQSPTSMSLSSGSTPNFFINPRVNGSSHSLDSQVTWTTQHFVLILCPQTLFPDQCVNTLMPGTTFCSSLWPQHQWPCQAHNKCPIKLMEWMNGLSTTVCCGDIGHIQSCASRVAQGPQAVIPTGSECHPHTGALLAGSRPRLRGR